MTLRHALRTLAAFALLLSPSVGAQDLILTGVIDATLPGGQPKAVELYVVNDIADLSTYGISSANNGGGPTTTPEFTFPADAASAGDFLYVASVAADFQTWFGFAADYESSAANVNGDDAIELFQNGAVVDVFGEVNTDGTGQPWEYTNGWAYRMDGTGPDGSTFVLGNWTYSGVDALNGETSNGTAAVPFPVGTYSAGGGSTDPVVSFVPTTGSVTEGGTSTLTLQINFDGGTPTGQAVTVAVSLTGGSADASDVSGPTPASVTFSGTTEGETRTVSVTAVDDADAEADETAVFGASVTSGTATASGAFTLTILDNDDAMEMTLAEARAAGVGAVVTVTGTVSRAMGAFTYFQDDTAGLTIRQTSGAFFDAVASGAIAAGTEVTVTGTLSEFNSLLQINNADLQSYTVGATGDAPAAQTITLAQLAANGEAYEAELVTVDALTIDAQGMTEFATGNYTVSNGSDTGTLRIPNANDTDADGAAIPANPAVVTAVVGQFDNADPGPGYQLLLIRASDISVIVSGEATETGALSLAVANPLRGAVTVRFATGAPGTVSLALYDALGRRAATLADGETDGTSRTATLDASALAAGVYVLRLESEAGFATRTLTVVR